MIETLVSDAPGKIILVQETSKEEDAVPGKFFDLSTRVNYDELRVVWLKTNTGRICYQYRGGRPSDPLCFSDDGLRPSTHAQAPQHKTCAGCPMNQWGAGCHPVCRDNWNMLVVLRDSRLPRWFRPGPGATKTLRAYLRRVGDDSFISTNEGRGERKLYDYGFTVRPVRLKKGRYSFWAAEFADWQFLERVTLPVGRTESQYQKDFQRWAVDIVDIVDIVDMKAAIDTTGGTTGELEGRADALPI